MRLANGIPVCAAAFALLAASSAFAQTPFQRGREAPGGLLQRIPVMSALDKNKDGEISAEEIENAAAALKTLDRDGNGKLTEDELRPNFGGGWGLDGRRRQGRPQRPQRPAEEKEEKGQSQESRASDGKGRASRRAGSGARRTGGPVRLKANGLELGMPLPDVDVYDEAGDAFRFSSLKGQYTVVVFGCLT